MEIEILNMIGKIRTPILDRIMVFITSLGNGGIIFIVLALVLISIKKYRKIGLTVLISLLLCFLFGNLLLKPIVARVRPFKELGLDILISHPKDASFPSGHTFASVASAMSIYFYNKKYGVIIFVFAGLIAFSRMYLYLHYPTDILGGIILGLICAIISKRICDKVYG